MQIDANSLVKLAVAVTPKTVVSNQRLSGDALPSTVLKMAGTSPCLSMSHPPAPATPAEFEGASSGAGLFAGGAGTSKRRNFQREVLGWL